MLYFHPIIVVLHLILKLKIINIAQKIFKGVGKIPKNKSIKINFIIYIPGNLRRSVNYT